MNFLRIIWISIIGLCLSTLNAAAQPNLDSLWAVWSDETNPDTVRLKAINKFAFDGHINSQPDSAFYFAQLQYDFAEARGLKKHMAHALSTQASSLSLKSEYTRSREYHRRSLEISKQIGFRDGVAGSLANIGQTYMTQGDYDKAIDYYNQSAHIYKKSENKKGIARTLCQIGGCYRNKGDFILALDLNNQSFQLAQDIGDMKIMSGALQNLGNIHRQQGNYATAIDNYTRCLKLKEETGDEFGIALLIMNIAGSYCEQHSWEECIEYFRKALNLFEKFENNHGIAACLNGFGVAYEQQGMYNEAIKYLTECLEIRERIGDKQGIAMVLGNIGVAYKNQGNYLNAINYQNRSMQLNEEIGQRTGVATALHNLSLVYQKQNDYVNAIHYANSALEIAQDIGAVMETANAAESLWNAYKNLGNYKASLTMYELFIQMRDSIASNQNIKEFARFEFKYEYEKKALADSLRTLADKETLALNHQVEIAQKETERNLYASAGLFLLFITFLFYQRKVNKNKLVLKEKEAAYQQELIYASINSQENERRRIARDLHDEVGAMLSTLKLQLGAVGKKLSATGATEDPTKPALSLVDETITNVRRISKDLLPPTLEEFGLAHALEDLADKVASASGIVINKDIQPLSKRLEVERELALYRVIQEMMNNALKHAEATEFDLAMHEKDGRLSLSFSDNGKGFELDAIKKSKAGKTGLGLKNLENRVGAAGGEMELVSSLGSGTKLAVWMPLVVVGTAA